MLIDETMPDGPGEPLSVLQSADAAFDRLMCDIQALDTPQPSDPRPAAERVAELLSTLVTTPAAPAPDRPTAARSFDLLSGLMAEMMAAVAQYVDWGLRGAEQKATTPRDTSVTLTGSPGNRTGTPLFMHGNADPGIDLSTFRLTDLTTHHGFRIAGTAGTFCVNSAVPSRDGSVGIWFEVTIPDDSATGTYHGHILTAASPEKAINVRVSVHE